MLSGMMNADNVSQILRGISQKRQNGVMELNFADKSVQLYFVSGKIVDAVDSEHPVLQELQQWLIAGQYVGEDFDISDYHTLQELFLALNERGVDAPLIDEARFRRVVRERVLNTLHRLNFENPAVFGFKMQMVEYDRNFAPSISVGQVLLDRVAYETDAERFATLFPQEASLRRADIGGEVLSEDEQAIYDALSEELPLALVRSKSLLSLYRFQSALLGLHSRAAVEVEIRSNPTREEIAGALSDELFDALETSTERPFIPQGQLAVEGEKVLQNGNSHNGTGEVAGAPVTKESAHVQAAGSAIELDEEYEELDTEDLEDDDEDESDEEMFSEEIDEPSINFFTYYNIKLLQYQAIPNLLIALFLAALVLIPYYTWGKVFSEF